MSARPFYVLILASDDGRDEAVSYTYAKLANAMRMARRLASVFTVTVVQAR